MSVVLPSACYAVDVFYYAAGAINFLALFAKSWCFFRVSRSVMPVYAVNKRMDDLLENADLVFCSALTMKTQQSVRETRKMHHRTGLDCKNHLAVGRVYG